MAVLQIQSAKAGLGWYESVPLLRIMRLEIGTVKYQKQIRGDSLKIEGSQGCGKTRVVHFGTLMYHAAMTHAPAAPVAAEAPPYVPTPRQRLLDAMARCVADKGFTALTIADIVREASVSRRTFYEHFSTKDECLAALYQAASNSALSALRATLDPQRSWQSQLDGALKAYLGRLASNPMLLRTIFVEILGLGKVGLQARRRVNQDIADFLRAVLQAAPEGVVISPEMAMVMVGGINELILQLIEQDRTEDMLSIVGTAGALLRAVVAAEHKAAAKPPGTAPAGTP